MYAHAANTEYPNTQIVHANVPPDYAYLSVQMRDRMCVWEVKCIIIIIIPYTRIIEVTRIR